MALVLQGTVDSMPFGDDEDVAPTLSAPAPVEARTEVAKTAEKATVSLETLADEGFKGLAFDWTAFPMIALKTDGLFEDSNGQNYGKSFTCRLVGSQSKFSYSFAGATDPKNNLIYSYDKVISTSGKSVEEFKQGLRAQGKEPIEKEYLEVFVEMVAPGEDFDGEFRLLSVSPTSKGRFSSFMFKLQSKGVAKTALVKIEVGDKVRNVPNPFYPWNFVVA